ncbi:hypothetical protein ACJX0J_007315 [Zea mays]
MRMQEIILKLFNYPSKQAHAIILNSVSILSINFSYFIKKFTIQKKTGVWNQGFQDWIIVIVFYNHHNCLSRNTVDNRDSTHFATELDIIVDLNFIMEAGFLNHLRECYLAQAKLFKKICLIYQF